MAQTKTTTVAAVFVNNSSSPTFLATAKTVEAFVVENQLVADPRAINPGVINP